MIEFLSLPMSGLISVASSDWTDNVRDQSLTAKASLTPKSVEAMADGPHVDGSGFRRADLARPERRAFTEAHPKRREEEMRGTPSKGFRYPLGPSATVTPSRAKRLKEAREPQRAHATAGFCTCALFGRPFRLTGTPLRLAIIDGQRLLTPNSSHNASVFSPAR
jgi:hypothetical protein